MKVIANQSRAAVETSVRWSRGFTLLEMIITMSIFSFVVLAFVYAHIFGMRQDELVQSKLGASDQARRGFGLMAQDIRASKLWRLGNLSGTTFTSIPNGTLQKGNALQLNLTMNTNVCVRYYFAASGINFDTSTNKLFRSRVSNNITLSTDMIANYLTNDVYFSAEKYDGTTRTNVSYKSVINVIMQFQQYQYPLTKVGAGYLYDYYKMQFKITPHVPDGA